MVSTVRLCITERFQWGATVVAFCCERLVEGEDTVMPFERKSFTAMSDAAIGEVLSRQRLSGERYQMWLSGSDFSNFIRALAFVADEGPESLADWAADFVAGVAETLDVEFI